LWDLQAWYIYKKTAGIAAVKELMGFPEGRASYINMDETDILYQAKSVRVCTVKKTENFFRCGGGTSDIGGHAPGMVGMRLSPDLAIVGGTPAGGIYKDRPELLTDSLQNFHKLHVGRSETPAAITPVSLARKLFPFKMSADHMSLITRFFKNAIAGSAIKSSQIFSVS
jgi:hypothetical protein